MKKTKIIDCVCGKCGMREMLLTTEKKYKQYMNGEDVMKIFKEEKPSQKKTLHSGICFNCSE